MNHLLCQVGIGAGMSPQLPGWRGLLIRMLDWVREQRIALDGMEDPIRDLIVQPDGDLLLAVHELQSRIGEPNFHRFIQEVFRDPGLTP